MPKKEELKEIEERISKELTPFLDGIRTKHADYELFKQAYNDYQNRLGRAIGIMGVLLKAGLAKPPSELIEDLMELFRYMGYVESMGNIIVNIIVMLLVANGRDFHIECRYTTPRIKHVVSIKDLEDERVPLTTKLNFLRDNGITGLASVIDSELRNKIAHLKFDVRRGRDVKKQHTAPLTTDRIFVKGKPASEVASNSTQKLLSAISTTLNLLEQLAEAKGIKKKK